MGKPYKGKFCMAFRGKSIISITFPEAFNTKKIQKESWFPFEPGKSERESCLICDNIFLTFYVQLRQS